MCHVCTSHFDSKISTIMTIFFLFISIFYLFFYFTVFVVNMRLRRRRTGELTGEFTEPVYVSLSPDSLEVKTAMTSCIQKLVNASRGFPRPEQGLAQSFGGTYLLFPCAALNFFLLLLRLLLVL